MGKFDIDYLSKLAKIELKKEEKERLAKELKKILKFVEKLNELDISKERPLSHVIDLKNIFRQDKVLPSLSQKKVIKLAPRKGGGFVKVPKILKR